MKRGSSALRPPPPPPDAAQRLTQSVNMHTHTDHRADRPHEHSNNRLDTRAASSSPFLVATSLFSPDVSTKMASDLLIRLSEATQKALVHPGSGAEAERREALPEGQGGQQDEPGPALSPDGPGASPNPPSLTLTPDGDAATDTLASDLLRKLAESQVVTPPGVKVKEEEESMEINTLTMSDLIRDSPSIRGRHLVAVKREPLNWMGMADPRGMCAASCRVPDSGLTDGPLAVKQEKTVLSRHMEEETRDKFLSGVSTEEQLFFGDQLCSGAKMVEQCLRAALWQDMSVNLASTLLYQLSGRHTLNPLVNPFFTLCSWCPERVTKSNSLPAQRTSPPTSSLVLKAEPTWTSRPLDSPHGSSSSIRSGSFFYRCHVCGFETDGRFLFHNHMMEHRQRERGSFSLRCCVCDHSTTQEAAMKVHADTHLLVGVNRCPFAPPASSAPTVATATPLETSTSEHRCRICQRSFPGQQELLVHFQGHRQGNQYRCERCGHLTRTANKLVEHVRVHTGERPFTCDLCPYSAKRRDSLRLHCKVKHASRGVATTSAAATSVHTHRSYAHGNDPSKHVGRLHSDVDAAHTSLPPSLCDGGWRRDLSPMVSITTLLAVKARSPAPPSYSPFSSNKLSFLGYLGLTSL
ncbi:zinc finger protein 827-like isoform X1 [Nerophis lumbriciformis]|uniref:zinc finger protein 827-like isoform X1 n=1 Tax=Nerophis lumbriciformis TaxID=546530 RepID=UPI003BA9C2FC